MAAAKAPATERAGAALAAALPWAVWVIGAAPRLAPPWTLNHDAAWFAHVAGRWLDGATLYVDVVDVNPPLIVYLSALPAWLAAASGLPVAAVVHAAVLAAGLVSLLLAGSILRRAEPGAWRRCAVMVAVAAIVTALPGADFAQREHLTLIAVVPLALRWTVASPRIPLPQRIAIGALAGLGVALKPILVAAFGVAWAVRRWAGAVPCRAEHAAAAGVLAAYAGHVLLLPAEMRAGLWETAALAWHSYGGYDAGWAEVVGHPRAWTAAALALAAAGWPQRHRSPGSRTLAGFAGLLLAAAMVQHKGFAYHYLPALGVAWLAAARQLARALSPRAARAAAIAIAGACGLAALERQPNGIGLRWQKPWRHAALEANAIAAVARGRSVLPLDTELTPAFPALTLAGIPLAGRFGCLWPLAGTAGQAAADGTEPWPHRALRQALRADWQHAPPGVVLVRRPPLGFVDDPRFDVLDWLHRDAVLAAEWGSYALAARHPHHDVFVRRSVKR